MTPNLERKCDAVELRHEEAAPGPAQVTAMIARTGVAGEAPCRGREIRTLPQLDQNGIGEGQCARLGCLAWPRGHDDLPERNGRGTGAELACLLVEERLHLLLARLHRLELALLRELGLESGLLQVPA